MSVKIVQVDAFTAKPFAGNPAAVCVLPAAPNEAWMRDVAREMNLSETAFLHPELHRDDTGYQQWQALIALGSGGMWGLGLGNSRQKMYYLPEVNTDFVFPIIGEELGLWIALAIVLAFLIMNSTWINAPVRTTPFSAGCCFHATLAKVLPSGQGLIRCSATALIAMLFPRTCRSV